jgi:hypothetical protein
MLYDMTWRIPREQIRLLEARMLRVKSIMNIYFGIFINLKRSGGSKSLGTGSKSFTSGSFNDSVDTEAANSKLSAKQANANGVKCAYKRFQQTRNITFNKEELSHLKEVRK